MIGFPDPVDNQVRYVRDGEIQRRQGSAESIKIVQNVLEGPKAEAPVVGPDAANGGSEGNANTGEKK